MNVDTLPVTDGTTAAELAALRRELQITWEAHEREHKQHEISHEREHIITQRAVDTAAELGKANKADANEWRASMNDREAKFATKADIAALDARLDGIERALLVADERERSRLVNESAKVADADRRIARSQWTIGLTVGLLATVGAVLINLVLRLIG